MHVGRRKDHNSRIYEIEAFFSTCLRVLFDFTGDLKVGCIYSEIFMGIVS